MIAPEPAYIPATVPRDEDARLASLRALGLIGTPLEERFDRLTRLAAKIFAAESAITLVDADRLRVKSSVGSVPEIDRDVSFCAHVILGDETFVVEDTGADPRFSANPLVACAEPLGFYAGHPLHAPDGARVGSFCLLGAEPRPFSPDDRRILADLAGLVERELAGTALSDVVDDLRARAAHVRAIADAAAEGSVAVDSDGRVTDINPAALMLLGLRPGQAQGRGLTEIVPADEAAEWFASVLGGERGLSTLRTAVRPPSGEPFDARLAAAPIRIAGIQTGAVVTVTDLSDVLAAEEVRRQVVGTVSHELRTPLTSIIGYLDALAAEESGPLNSEQHNEVDVALRNARRLGSLVEDLLLLERMDAGALQVRRTMVDLGRNVRDVAAEVSAAAVDAGVAVDVRAPDGLILWSDERHVTQVVSNLISNAVKFTPRGGTIRVRAYRTGDELTVEVTDDGVGIPAVELARLGTRFYRASSAGTVSGTGLGLAIVRDLLEAHGGRLEISSVLDEGSVFRAIMPADRREGVRDASERSSP